MVEVGMVEMAGILSLRVVTRMSIEGSFRLDGREMRRRDAITRIIILRRGMRGMGGSLCRVLIVLRRCGVGEVYGWRWRRDDQGVWDVI